ncbi:hypothetical protein OOK27_22015 [Streptomyces canus]|uniref:hypothetical protein n=1 Tax=Streptomyces canus TaxID=58343 RepID=UPI00224F40A5|nr:hypothetical protein [Streptomyces canus]MCX5256778.1 hypothetical protein [Streptomyces canus]
MAVVFFTVLAAFGLAGITHAGATTATSGDFFAVSPSAKIVDTRSAVGVSATLGATSTNSFQVLGQGGIPNSGVSAVSLDITTTNATSSGSYLEMWPDGNTRPYPASVINFSSSADASNSAIVAVGSDGKIDVYNSSGTVNVIVSVNGYFTSDGGDTSPGGFVPVTQSRLVDTRDGTGAPEAQIAPGGTLNVQIDGVDGITDEGSVYANITVPSPGASGSLYAYAAGGSAGQPVVDYKSVTTSQGAVIPVGSGGQITLKNGSSTQPIDVVLDVYGYFTNAPSGGGVFSAVQDRLLDTRTSTAIPANSSVSVTVAGNDGIPTSFGAAVLNLTTTGQQNSGYLRVWPTGQTMPSTTSVDNFQANTSTADLVIAQPGTQGAVSIYNASAGTIQLLVDLQGWFSSTQTTATPDPTDTAPDPTSTESDPKPTANASVSPAPAVSDSPAPSVSASGAATVAGIFTNGAGTGLGNMTVTLSDADVLTDTSSDVQLPAVGNTTTASDGSWSYTLPDPLPSNLQTLADANNGVLNLSATVDGYASDGTLLTAIDHVSAGVAEGTATTQASQDVRANSTPHTMALHPETDTTALDAPSDTEEANSTSQAMYDSPDPTGDTSTTSTYQSLTPNVSLNPDVVNGVNYANVVPEPNSCTNSFTTLKTEIRYTTVGEAHAYWDAKASFDYSSTMSSSIGVAFSANGGKWSITGGSSETGNLGHATGYSGKGPYFARQWRVPINYGYEKVRTYCARGGTTYGYEIRPLGYKIPSGGYVAEFGKDVSGYDGYSGWANTYSSRRGKVPAGGYFSLIRGHSFSYTVAASVFGVSISATTMYNTNHTQKIEAGSKTYDEHDIWGAKAPLYDNPGTFYSY